jgi:putative NIF3 family GTP cyclohydrolase 1 type 2
MIENSSEINKVYGTVFLDRSVLDKIIKRREKNILIFTHHPMEDQTSGGGFTALDLKYLEKIRQLKISVYVVHTPFEMNKKISVTGSINKALGLKNIVYIKNESYDFFLPIGELSKKMKVEDFIFLLKDLLKVEKINFIKKQEFVERIAVLSGGCTDIQFIKTATNLKCDTFLTGEYYNKLKLPLGEEERKIFDAEKDKLSINLIEGSHYATEKLVFVREISELFNKLKIPYEFIEQDDPWY